MPTYDYVCDACDHSFELFQQITAPVKRKCPACGQLRLRRLVGTGAGVIFKGGGFYETDYRSESYRKAAEAEKKAATGGDSGKSDSTKDKAADTKAKKSESTKDSTGPKTGSDSKSKSRPAKPAAST
jgi:putative FmdB family regulatory protein